MEIKSIKAQDTDSVRAYAKLEGDNFCYYIRTLQVTLGRKAKEPDNVDIPLGNVKSISRQHARLAYNFTTQYFEFVVLGKNGAFVNDQFVEKGIAVPLENKTKIQIGDVSFIFLLPSIKLEKPDQEDEHADPSVFESKVKKPPMSYAELITEAITSTKDKKMTLNEIYKYVTSNYSYFRTATSGWQNSIRHNLSMNRSFVKIPRTSPHYIKKGCFWTVDTSDEDPFAARVVTIDKRSRKRRLSITTLENIDSLQIPANSEQQPLQMELQDIFRLHLLDPIKNPLPTSIAKLLPQAIAKLPPSLVSQLANALESTVERNSYT
ncbi:MAG: fork head domain-containing protein [Benjaminiella poitrasii]|nr:MAG: fork head domain-containing protein [Benjaminiella poitrasii]